MNEFLENLNNILNKLSLSIRANVYDYISRIANIDHNIFDINPIKMIYKSKIIKVVLICIWAIMLFIIFKTLINFYSNISIRNIYYYILRIIVIVILSTNSMYICEKVIVANSYLTEIITLFFEEKTNSKIEFSFIDENIDTIDGLFKSQDKIGIDGIKDAIVLFYLIFLLLFLSLRYVIIILCVLISPFSFILLLLRDTKRYFFFWLKIFIFSLILQNINLLLIFIPISAKKEDNFPLILLGTLMLLYKLNMKIGDFLNAKN